jgi:hypothetical protein
VDCALQFEEGEAGGCVEELGEWVFEVRGCGASRREVVGTE